MTKVDQKGRPSGSETQFSTIFLGRFWDKSSLFFEFASRERLDWQRKGPNLCFCYQAQYFHGLADFAEKTKIDQNRRKKHFDDASRTQRKKKLDFFANGRDLASIFVASTHFQALLGALLASGGAFRGSVDAPGELLGHSMGMPEMLQISFGCPGVHEEEPGICFFSHRFKRIQKKKRRKTHENSYLLAGKLLETVTGVSSCRCPLARASPHAGLTSVNELL